MVQVVESVEIICWNQKSLFKIGRKYNKLRIFYIIFLHGACKFIMNLRNVKKKTMFKIFEVMKSTFKTIFSYLFSDFTFSDIFWRCHFDIVDLSTYNSSRGHHEKKNQLKKHFGIFFIAFDQEFWNFSIAKPLFGPLYHACTHLAIILFKLLGSSNFMFWYLQEAIRMLKTKCKSKKTNYTTFWMKLTRNTGKKKGDQWGIGQQSMKKENFETRVCTCGHNN